MHNYPSFCEWILKILEMFSSDIAVERRGETVMYALFWGFCLGAFPVLLCARAKLYVLPLLLDLFLFSWQLVFFFSFILFFSISLAVGKTLILHKV